MLPIREFDLASRSSNIGFFSQCACEYVPVCILKGGVLPKSGVEKEIGRKKNQSHFANCLFPAVSMVTLSARLLCRVTVQQFTHYTLSSAVNGRERGRTAPFRKHATSTQCCTFHPQLPNCS